MLYFFPSTICECNKVPKLLLRKNGESSCWNDGMGMGYWWVSIPQIIKKVNTGAGGCLVQFPIKRGAYTLFLENFLYYLKWLSVGADIKLWSQIPFPQTCPYHRHKCYFYKILKHMFLKSLDYFCITQFCLKCLRELPVLSSSPSAMFSTANHPLRPAHLLEIPTWLPDFPFPPTCSDLRWIKFPHIVPF